MERRPSRARSYLERMLLDETAEPKALPLSLLEEITGGFSDDQQIGSGGFAVVYKGILGDRAVAVKRLSNVLMPEMQFHREVECLMQVKHNNIVRFFGYCADRQGLMERYNGKLVMADVHQRLLCFEYVTNGSLDKYIIDEYREWGTCYTIIKGICEGLQYLHENHIIHLDLKPANILLDDNMVPKITDFGLSRCFDENQSRHITKNILGTMGYLAPEVREGGVIARSADLYGLGVIILEILTGQKGYKSIDDVLESWSDRLANSQRDTQREQIRVCYKIALECRDFNPKKRPTSAREIIERLHEMESTRMGKLAGKLLRSFRSGKKDKGKAVSKTGSEETPKLVALSRTVTPESKQKRRGSFRRPPAAATTGLEETPKWVAAAMVAARQAVARSNRIEDAAVIKIQSAVRSYLARRELRILKGKRQVLLTVRVLKGRRQTTTNVQSIVAVQKMALPHNVTRMRSLERGTRFPQVRLQRISENDE